MADLDELRQRCKEAKSEKEYGERVSEFQRESLKQKRESNTEFQRRRRLSQDERSRESIERIGRDLKEEAEKRGTEKTFESAKREVEAVANIVERKRK